MIRVYLKEGADGAPRHRIIHQTVEGETGRKQVTRIGEWADGIFYADDDPTLAEIQYLALIRERTDGPGYVAVSPASGLEAVVPKGRYRTDTVWSGAPREQELERLRQVWPLGGKRAAPTLFQVRGLIRLQGWSVEDIVGLTGAGERTVKRWLSAREPQAMPSATWLALLVEAGFLTAPAER